MIRTIHLGVGGRGAWPIRQIPERDDFESVALVDVNGDNSIDISDPIYELAYLFNQGPAPVGGGECTPDSTPADPPLECDDSGCG